MKVFYVYFAMMLMILFLLEGNAFPWSLYAILTGNLNNKPESRATDSFNPDKDLLYLPPYEKNEFIQSIDDLSICRKKEVRKFIHLYLTSGREFLKSSIQKSYIYHGAIREYFVQAGMPEKISHLPLLESGFEPFAVSRSRAVGLWQFMRTTAIRLGIRSDGWIDERRHLEISTKSAIRHLRNLHGVFGSWDLALAAYNGGAGHVKRALMKSKTTDFWKLAESGALRPESAEFVPRFAALLIIYENQALFGVNGEIDFREDITLGTETVHFVGRINLPELARALGVSTDSIRKLNPELNANVTPPYCREYSLRLPAGASEKISASGFTPDRTPQPPRIKSHVVRPGECITSIAEKYNSRAQLIVRYNGLKNPDIVQAGRILYIPY